jgi:hypothetical protein
MSAIEVEMAIAPNQEILRNIGVSPDAATPSPTEPIFFHQPAESPLRSRRLSRREKRNSQTEIAGVWKDGAVAWEPTPEPSRPTTSDGKLVKKRPKIQVIIPEGSTRRRFSSVPFPHHESSKPGDAVAVSPPTCTSVISDVSSLDIFDVSPPAPLVTAARRASGSTAGRISPISGVDASLTTAVALLQVPTRPAPGRPSSSGSSSSTASGADEDGTSDGASSHRSSMTSVDSDGAAAALAAASEASASDAESAVAVTKLGPRLRARNASRAREMAGRRPVHAGKAVREARGVGSPTEPAELDARLQPPPPPPSAGGEPAPKPQAPRLADLIHIVRTPSTQQPRGPPSRRRSVRSFSGSVRRMRTLPEEDPAANGGDRRGSDAGSSPTLSEAERSLEAHLEGLTPVMERGDDASPWEDVPEAPPLRRYSVPRKPLPPPKSARRLSLHAVEEAPEPEKVMRTTETNQCALARSSSVRSTLSLIPEEDDAGRPVIARDDAERVIYALLARANDLRDLRSLAAINRGFRGLFKRGELALTEQVLKNMSPAAWEFMKSRGSWERLEPDSAAPEPEETACTFRERYARAARVVAGVKALIARKCRFVLRPETARGLATHDALRASRIDDALWRIWTFCRVFGRDGGREDEAVAQADWLRGGAEAHETAAQGTISSTDSVFMHSALVITSEHFGRGNGEGLGAEALYDMTELWNCLRSISQGIVGQTEQARAHGVFDDTDVRGGDIEGEEVMLGTFF